MLVAAGILQPTTFIGLNFRLRAYLYHQLVIMELKFVIQY